MKLNWNFLREGRVQNKKPYMGGVWIFSGTAHYKKKGVLTDVSNINQKTSNV